MKPKLVVTGGSGFIGYAIAKKALSQFDVTIYDLAPPPKEEPFHYIQGDILNPKQLYHALFNADVVIHAAANPNLWHPNKSQLMAINFLGTQNVIKACKALHVDKLLYISSDCTLTSPNHKVITESTQTTLADMKGAYCQSKWLAEQAVLEAKTNQFHTMTLNPGVPIGTTSQQAPFIQMLNAFSRGQIKGVMKGHIGMIDVEDIATLSVQALLQGTSGHRYLAVSEVWSLEKLFGLLGKEMQQEVPTWVVPYWLANTAAKFQEFGARFTKKPPLATQAGLYLARHTQRIDNTQTKNALNIQFQSIEPALVEMIKAFKP